MNRDKKVLLAAMLGATVMAAPDGMSRLWGFMMRKRSSAAVLRRRWTQVPASFGARGLSPPPGCADLSSDCVALPDEGFVWSVESRLAGAAELPEPPEEGALCCAVEPDDAPPVLEPVP